MRTSCWLTCALVLLAPLSVAAEPAAHRMDTLAWLLGSWQRTGLPAGSVGTETWRREGDDFVGVGSRYKQGRLAFEEKLRLTRDGDDVFYVADVAENPTPVRFRLVAQDAHSATFENPAHDFPKRIAYRLQGELLEVVTSGDGREVIFRFRRAP